MGRSGRRSKRWPLHAASPIGWTSRPDSRGAARRQLCRRGLFRAADPRARMLRAHRARVVRVRRAGGRPCRSGRSRKSSDRNSGRGSRRTIRHRRLPSGWTTFSPVGWWPIRSGCAPGRDIPNGDRSPRSTSGFSCGVIQRRRCVSSVDDALVRIGPRHRQAAGVGAVRPRARAAVAFCRRAASPDAISEGYVFPVDSRHVDRLERTFLRQLRARGAHADQAAGSRRG